MERTFQQIAFDAGAALVKKHRIPLVPYDQGRKAKHGVLGRMPNGKLVWVDCVAADPSMGMHIAFSRHEVVHVEPKGEDLDFDSIKLLESKLPLLQQATPFPQSNRPHWFYESGQAVAALEYQWDEQWDSPPTFRVWVVDGGQLPGQLKKMSVEGFWQLWRQGRICPADQSKLVWFDDTDHGHRHHSLAWCGNAKLAAPGTLFIDHGTAPQFRPNHVPTAEERDIAPERALKYHREHPIKPPQAKLPFG